ALYPPQQVCSTLNCVNEKKLMKAMQRPAVLYTLNNGPIATYTVDLKCEECNVTFHHNYYVDYKAPKNSCQRTYYKGVPDIIHVGGHQFVETAVIRMWRTMNVVSWSSMSNCARLYNLALSHQAVPPDDFPYSFSLSGDHVWSGIVQLSLLEDLLCRGETLAVQHSGLHRDRFTAAIQVRNRRIQYYGQEELCHYCSKCTSFYDEDDDGKVDSKLSVIVIDGVTVGHPCCSVHNCHNPLANNRDRFCLTHSSLDGVCTIIGCDNPTIPAEGSSTQLRTCSDPAHYAVEAAYTERGQARFQLREHLERAHVSNPSSSNTRDIAVDEIDDDSPLEEDFDVNERDEVVMNAAATPQRTNRKVKAQFGCKRTHNEQLFVAPCSMIIARETFYGAEGVASVIICFKFNTTVIANFSVIGNDQVCVS
ncbi:hypothetical protein DFJ58DRAFT_666720, partial [Suillus subalutaceus]|uniref:uncharacterized protein n=1 Tax=Suillus subalutaceus TaxID=48586 RepID=UPI001B8802E6